MYSVVLMVGMTAGGDSPQGLLDRFRGSGCAGSGSAAQVDAPQRRTPIRNLLAHVGAAVAAPSPRSVAFGSGCSGTVALAGSGCGGGGNDNFRTVGAAGGPLLDRLAVHRVLRVALAQADAQGKLTPEQSEQVRELIGGHRVGRIVARGDQDLYEAVVTKVHRDILRDMRSEVAKGQTFGAFGDGHILQMIFANLPKIIDAITQIMKIFGHAWWGSPLLQDYVLAIPCFDSGVPCDWLPMPVGPPPVRVVPHWSLAC